MSNNTSQPEPTKWTARQKPEPTTYTTRPEIEPTVYNSRIQPEPTTYTTRPKVATEWTTPRWNESTTSEEESTEK